MSAPTVLIRLAASSADVETARTLFMGARLAWEQKPGPQAG
jgi:hypothetical protein